MPERNNEMTKSLPLTRTKSPFIAVFLFLLSLSVQARPSTPPEILATYKSNALTRALKDPKTAWEFIISPDTPYLDRRAAAIQARPLFQRAGDFLDWLSRLNSAFADLRKVEWLWGIRMHPDSAAMRNDEQLRTTLKGIPESKRTRRTLGHLWRVPVEPIDFPLTWEAESRAPWPWQVQKALQELYFGFGPQHEIGPRAEEQWTEKMLKLPTRTDIGATQFVALTSRSEVRNLSVLARWRRFTLDPRYPRTAVQIAVGISPRWYEQRSNLIARLINLDIITLSPHKQARSEAMYRIRELRETSDGPPSFNRILLPVPFASVLAASKRALDPADDDEFNRLYRIFAICGVLDDRPLETSGLRVGPFTAGRAWNRPPLVPKGGISPGSPEVPIGLKAFEDWFKAHRAELEAAAGKETPELDKARQLLEGSE